ncbi:MAG: hypothetical protein WC853_12545 [Thermodesulfovibrionales bacterium]
MIDETKEPNPLPYDMGNAGDLIKHGLLAEYTAWWTRNKQGKFIFYDPFGGRPYVSPPNQIVTARISSLNGCALNKAQNDSEKYYGSGHIVKNIASVLNGECEIYTSDRDDNAYQALIASGLMKINIAKFDRTNAYTILDCNFTKMEPSLILIDPFAEFLRDDAKRIIPKITNFIRNHKIPVLLFVLNLEPSNRVGKAYSELINNHFQDLCEIALICPKLKNTGVKGESKYISEARLIYPPKLFTEKELFSFKEQVVKFKTLLEAALNRDANIIALVETSSCKT